jgi:hypothetical protein
MGAKIKAVRAWARNLPKQFLTGKSPSFWRLVRGERAKIWAERREVTKAAFLDSFSPSQREAWKAMGKVKAQLAQLTRRARQGDRSRELGMGIGRQAKTLHKQQRQLLEQLED